MQTNMKIKKDSWTTSNKNATNFQAKLHLICKVNNGWTHCTINITKEFYIIYIYMVLNNLMFGL